MVQNTRELSRGLAGDVNQASCPEPTEKIAGRAFRPPRDGSTRDHWTPLVSDRLLVLLGQPDDLVDLTDCCGDCRHIGKRGTRARASSRKRATPENNQSSSSRWPRAVIDDGGGKGRGKRAQVGLPALVGLCQRVNHTSVCRARVHAWRANPIRGLCKLKRKTTTTPNNINHVGPPGELGPRALLENRPMIRERRAPFSSTTECNYRYHCK